MQRPLGEHDAVVAEGVAQDRPEDDGVASDDQVGARVDRLAMLVVATNVINPQQRPIALSLFMVPKAFFAAGSGPPPRSNQT